MIRRLTEISLIAGLVAFFGSTGLRAQNAFEKADVPFSFHAGDASLAPGKYVVERTTYDGVFRLSDSSWHSVFVPVARDTNGPEGHPSLTFRCYGDTCVLARISMADGSIYTRSDRDVEKQLHRRIDMAAVVKIALH